MLFAQAAALILAGASDAALAEIIGADTIIVTAPRAVGDEDDAVGISSETIDGPGKPDLFEALARSVPGLSLQEAQNNPFQPNLVYRGFTISPLQGQAQGLAVYLDGGRFNQPFGDTVQFDLLPEAAIQRIEILGADPVYGLNALGGAVVVVTKTGRSAPGLFLSGAAGRYGEAEGVAEAGWAGDKGSAYVALQQSHDGGWRRFSPSTLYNAFSDVGWDGENWGVHLKLVGADSDLTGNGSAPLELLDADYRAVFTHPDNTRNRFGRISIHPWVELAPSSRIEASLYGQHLRQSTLNGDAADIEACDDGALAGLLCLETADEEEAAVLVGADGGTIADVLGGEGYGVLNRSRTRTGAQGLLVQFVDRRSFGGGGNQLVIGFSHDRSRTRFDSSTELGALNEQRSVDGLGPVVAQPDGSITPVSLVAHNRHTGLFLSNALPITAGLRVEVGLRWNDARIRLDDRIGTVLDGNHRFRRLNPALAVRWQASSALVLRLSYAETNRAPTPAELACADEAAPCSLTNFFVADPPLKQVVARTIEAEGHGTIGDLDWRLSAYRATNQDDIHFVASDTRGRAFFRNIGRTRRQGMEFILGYQRGGLNVRAGYALTDATFRTPLLLNAPDNPGANTEGQIEVGRGDQLPGSPRHRGLLSVDYDTGRWSLGGDVQAASGQYLFGDEANLERRTDSYFLANIRASVVIAGPIKLFGQVRNLFDKRYATFGAFGTSDEIELKEAPGASNPRSLGPGAPRRWSVGLTTRF